MKSFKIKPHIADTRLEIQASSPKELFEVALLGMNHILKKDFCRKKHTNLIGKKISISANDKTCLLIDFLSEILTHSQIQKSVFCKLKIEKLGEKIINANIFGSKIRDFDKDIKAVSYHEAQVIKNKKGQYQTTIIFDI